jgi:dimethylargininase
MLVAITREVSPNIARCQLTHVERQPIDFARARAQHHTYEAQLATLGCEVHRLPSEPDLPDSVFVEDAAIVLDELAIITRPGAASRRPETASVAQALAPFRPLQHIEPPGTIDGGDVLCVDRTVFVGRSTRTNQAAIDQLRAVLEQHDYELTTVAVRRGLHLKSGVTRVADRTLLINRDWVDPGPFEALRRIDVDPSEPAAGNALLVGDRVLYPAAYPATRRRLDQAAIRAVAVDATELAKAEGGLTCCSLVFAVR